MKAIARALVELSELSGVARALYRETGIYYHRLTDFPGVLFDPGGYIEFRTPKVYRAHHNSGRLKISKNHTYVRNGINSIPGYITFNDSAKKKIRVLLHSDPALLNRAKTKLVVPSRSGNKMLRSMSPSFRDGDKVTKYLRGEQGFEVDPLTRKAIETAAVLKACRYYENSGFQVRKQGKPFDLECTRKATTLFVEVKGTQTTAAKIFLTPNEIKFAQKNQMSLFIVHSMTVTNGSDGPKARGGVTKIVAPWRPDRSRLTPVLFSYDVGPQA